MQFNPSKMDLTPKQKQAAIVCAICALALIITICVTAVQVTKAISAANGDEESASSSSTSTTTGYTGENYLIDANANSAILTETEDAGDEYLEETLFIGDSNTVRFYQNGLLTTQQYVAQEGLTIQKALTEEFVSFKNDDELYTIAEAVAMMKPRRVIITLGTNNADGSMSTDSFVAAYEELIDAILDSYEYTDIIINSIPPVTESQTSYPNLDQETIDNMNMALAEFAEESGYKFLNTAEVLKDSSGYGDEDYYVTNDIHLKAAGLNAILSYVTTHAYIADDRRPDTDDIAQRSASSSTASGTTSSSSSTSTYTAKYFIDSAGGGSLTSDGTEGSTTFSFDIEDTSDSVTVTAVPNDGYAFVKWSDGLTTATRTDTDFTQNVDVTAMFGEVGISIAINTSITALDAIKAGTNVEFNATLTGGYASATDIVWYVNDSVNALSSGASSWLTIASSTDYTIYATVTYNGSTFTSSAITIEQEKLISVPDVEWLTEAAAIAKLEAAGLTYSIVYKETTTTAQIGYVTSQGTAAGTEVSAGSSITLNVGKQATLYTVPDVKGLSVADATAKLTAAGFTGSITTTNATSYSDTYASGVVSGQSITANSSATADTAFVLTVSIGSDPNATVPTGITGVTVSAAKSALSGAGFTGTITVAYVDANGTSVTDQGTPNDDETVVSCSVTSGDSIAKTTPITLYVTYVESSSSTPTVDGSET